MKMTWKRYLGPQMRFYYETTIGNDKYFVTFNQTWQVEDSFGGVAGPFKTCAKAKQYIETLTR